MFREQKATIKQKCIPLLIQVIEQTTGSKMAQDLQIVKMADKFFMDLTSKTKHTSSGKMMFLLSLGFTSYVSDRCINKIVSCVVWICVLIFLLDL